MRKFNQLTDFQNQLSLIELDSFLGPVNLSLGEKRTDCGYGTARGRLGRRRAAVRETIFFLRQHLNTGCQQNNVSALEMGTKVRLNAN